MTVQILSFFLAWENLKYNSCYIIRIGRSLRKEKETKKVSFFVALIYFVLSATLFFPVIVYGQEEWLPYTPNPDDVELVYWSQNDVSYVEVSIVFYDSGFEISDWGTPVIIGNGISVNAFIWRWNGVVLPVVIVLKHTYNLGILPEGEYVFTFQSWWSSIESITFVVTRIPATLDIEPDALNLKSKCKWLTSYIEFPEGYNVNDINVSTITLNNTVTAELEPVVVGDYDNDGVASLMLKFNMTQIIAYICDHVDLRRRYVTVTLVVRGYLNDGTPFQGSDTTRAVMYAARYGMIPE
ncbi:hypothetical protein HXY33_05880 [Candidatus Bathyarchaeota archaeon]|nr:hypothetical protein [Candidatus Bathyarchaeota archaeon]